VQAQVPFIDKASEYKLNHSYNGFQAGGGISCVDFNQDGLDDISMASAKDQSIKFFVNTGLNSFEQVDLLEINSSDTKQLLWIDFDNDGDKDLFIAAYNGINKLYENLGSLELIDISIEAGIPQDSTITFGANFCDYNRDGWLDLYYVQRKRLGGLEPNQNRLFENQADGTFVEVSLLTNSSDLNRLPFCSVFADFNNDKWPDIYIANDRDRRNTLLLNLSGFFADASEVSESDLEMSAMSTTIGDYNRDGLMDIYVTNLTEGNKFLVNDKDYLDNIHPVFNEVADELDIAVNGNCWGAVFLDGNNDGYLDLYVSNALAGADTVRSAYFEQNQDGQFQNLNHQMIGDTVLSYNNAIGDFNDDGFPDIIVQNRAPHNANLWENQAIGNNWIKVKLEGIKSNKDGIGSRLELYTDEGYQQLYTTAAIGFLGQNSDTYLFGLKHTNSIDSLIITWPTGHKDVHLNLNANQKYELFEGQTTDGVILIDSDVILLEADIDSNPSTYILEEENYLVFNCYPNPSHSKISIASTIELDKTAISIFDVFGRSYKVLRNESEINIDQFPDGEYFILLEFEGKIFSEKFIKGL